MINKLAISYRGENIKLAFFSPILQTWISCSMFSSDDSNLIYLFHVLVRII